MREERGWIRGPPSPADQARRRQLRFEFGWIESDCFQERVQYCFRVGITCPCRSCEFLGAYREARNGSRIRPNCHEEVDKKSATPGSSVPATPARLAVVFNAQIAAQP